MDPKPNVLEPSSCLDDCVTEPVEPEPEVDRDDIYYFDTIVFKVENTLFRVPKKGFQAADFFETLFSLPQPKGRVEGSDDTCPLTLHGITKAYFRGFLRVLYPFNGTATTYDEWLGALDLATMWDFKEIRSAAVKELSKHIIRREVVENILLAKKYKVKQWLRDGYLRLMQQSERLNVDQLRSTDVDLLTIAGVCSIYGTILANRLKQGYCRYCGRNYGNTHPEITDVEANPLITQVFADELREMEDF